MGGGRDSEGNPLYKVTTVNGKRVYERIAPYVRLGIRNKAKSSVIKQGLTPEEKGSVEYYVSGDGMWINNALRNPEEDYARLSPEDEQYLRDLDKATNSEIVQEKKLWRNVDASVIGLDEDDIQELLYPASDKELNTTYRRFKDVILARRQKIQSLIGTKKDEAGFMSTTKDEQVARNWGDFTGSSNPVTIEFDVPSGTRGYDAKEFDIEDDPQREVLLPRNTQYQITDISVNRRTMEITIHAKITKQS